MPKQSGVRSEIMTDLVSQVRFASREALLKQVRNAEALAGEIDAGRNYPEDWLVFRVTGFAPDIAVPRLIDGAALLRDLSALVEHLCVAAQVGETDDAAKGLSVEALCTRWGVTRRTLERYRRYGLVARRVRSGAARGRARLVFTEGAVAAFEKRRGDSLGPVAGRAAPRKRMMPQEKQACIDWAARFHARSGCTMNETAVRLSRRTGRATSSLRRLLANAATTGSALVPVADGALGRRERELALRAVRAGVSLRRIGARLDRTPGGVSRAIAVARLEAITRFGFAPYEGAESDDRNFDELRAELAADPLVQLDDHWWIERGPLVAGIPEHVGLDAALSPAQERALVVAYSLLRRRVARAVARSDRTRPQPILIDEAETALRWSSRLKRRLLRGCTPLILRTLAERAAPGESGTGHAFPRCLLAASAAIDAFVPERGGRLAAPVSLALARELGGPLRRETPAPVTVPELWAIISPWDRHLAMPDAVRRGAGLMQYSEAAPLLARFGTPTEPPMTAAGVLSEWGLTAAAWWSLYRRACRLAARQRRAIPVIHRPADQRGPDARHQR